MIPNDNSACPEREHELQAYLFGELSGGILTELERHLEGCEGCRQALDEARIGFNALKEIETELLPYAESPPMTVVAGAEEQAWSDFLRRIPVQDSRAPERDFSRRNSFALGAVAAAATLIIGIGLGRWVFGPGLVSQPSRFGEAAAQGIALRIDREAIDALVRAEFLADLAVPYVNNVLQVWSQIMDLDPERAAGEELDRAGIRARELIRDGWLLKRGLDPDRDEVFLSLIGRAELFLEEVAALDDEDEAIPNLILLQETLRGSSLGDRLVALDVNGALVSALEASGWIGEEYESSMELRR